MVQCGEIVQCSPGAANVAHASHAILSGKIINLILITPEGDALVRPLVRCNMDCSIRNHLQGEAHARSATPRRADPEIVDWRGRSLPRPLVAAPSPYAAATPRPGGFGT